MAHEGASDGHQRPAGIGSPDPGRRDERHNPADEQHGDQDPERPLLGGAVADDLEVDLSAAECHGVGQDPDGCVPGCQLADVPLPRAANGVDRGKDRQPCRDHGPGRREWRSFGPDDHREHARCPATEAESARGQVIVRPRSFAGGRICLRRERGGPRCRERAIDGHIQDPAEDEQHDERERRAPQREVQADTAQQACLGRGDHRGRPLGDARVLGRAVSHRPAGTRLPGPSRSSVRQHRACHAGNGCTHRPRSG